VKLRYLGSRQRRVPNQDIPELAVEYSVRVGLREAGGWCVSICSFVKLIQKYKY
jgi:hypothetical protein